MLNNHYKNLGPIGELLAFFARHKSDHTGQTEYLRQLTRKADAVI